MNRQPCHTRKSEKKKPAKATERWYARPAVANA
jgi:hypothetical protein